MNESKVSGVIDQAKGSVKQAVGETFNNQSLANEGAADQVKGHAKEAWGSVKDAASNIGNSNKANEEKSDASETGHNLRDSITQGAANVKESIQRGLGHAENKANE